MMRRLVLELEDIVSQAATTSTDELKFVTSDLLIIRSQLHESTKCMRSWLEEIWSDIIVKDCAFCLASLSHGNSLAAAGLNGKLLVNIKNNLTVHGKRELEMELHAIKQQMNNVKGSDADMKKEQEVLKPRQQLNEFIKERLQLRRSYFQ
ncbi:hypothetical protein HAX54_024887 [Datura stramonium]|uniref:Uncharacterized protein n=1 Tax=Datura stramonium TaxID=4076 RepID=A0ABS8S5Z5_DATST|nr:hypothetical protein [Datura stramonium]